MCVGRYSSSVCIITYLFLKQGVVELMREIHIGHLKTTRMATAVITLIMIIIVIIAMMVVIIIVMDTIVMVIVIVAVATIHVSAIFQLNDIGVA